MSTSLKDDVMKAVNSSTYATKTEGTLGNYGWICPKCGAVMAPFVSTCINCRGNQYSEITTNTQINELDKYLSEGLLQKFNSITAKDTPPANYSISD